MAGPGDAMPGDGGDGLSRTLPARGVFGSPREAPPAGSGRLRCGSCGRYASAQGGVSPCPGESVWSGAGSRRLPAWAKPPLRSLPKIPSKRFWPNWSSRSKIDRGCWSFAGEVCAWVVPIAGTTRARISGTNRLPDMAVSLQERRRTSDFRTRLRLMDSARAWNDTTSSFDIGRNDFAGLAGFTELSD